MFYPPVPTSSAVSNLISEEKVEEGRKIVTKRRGDDIIEKRLKTYRKSRYQRRKNTKVFRYRGEGLSSL